MRMMASRGWVALLYVCITAGGVSACSNADRPAPSASTSTSGGGVGGGGGGAGGGPVTPVLAPAAGGVRRLITRQYVGSIRTIFGDKAALAATPPADPQLNGLEAIGASILATPASSVETYEGSARAVATAAVTDKATRAAILPCTPNGFTDFACLRAFVTKLGRIAWRRDLTDPEIVRVTGAGVAAAKAYSSFDAGLETCISALLQSPYFLYIVEVGAPDATDPTVRRLTPLELAARLSFFLLNSTPDAALLDAAEKGALDDEAGIRATAAAMLKRPEAKDALAAFYSEVYHLRDLATVQKDAALFPQFTESLKISMREETLRLIEDVVWTRDADASEILSADFTFVDADLAKLYGVPAPAGGGFGKVTLPPAQKRAGFLGHASFLTRAAHSKITSPTRRGNFVREALLCDLVPPPPPSVNPVLPDDGTPKTARQLLEQHIKDDSCKGCHSLMDPIGFSLDNYDAIGQYRTTDQGFPIDSTATVDDIGSFASAEELSALLVKDPRSAACTVHKLYRQSMGHLETMGEQPAMDDLVTAYAASGRSIQSLLVELSASPAFRLVGDPK